MCFILSLSSEASAGWKYNQWLGSTNNWNASGKTWDRKARGSPKQVPSKIFPHSSQRITKGMRSCPDPGTWLEEAALFPGFGWMGQLPRGTEGCQTPHSHPKNRLASRAAPLPPLPAAHHLAPGFLCAGRNLCPTFQSILASIFNRWVSFKLFNSLNSRNLNCSLESVLWLRGSPSPKISWHRAAEAPAIRQHPARRLRSSCPVACFSHPHLLLPRQAGPWASVQPLPLGSFQLTWPIFYQLKTEGIEKCWVTIGSVLFPIYKA